MQAPCTYLGGTQVLEFDDREGRLQRLETLLREIDGKPDPHTTRSSAPSPNTDLLTRVRNFLPEMQASNEKLHSQDAISLDIENIETDDIFIEMELGLGVFDLKAKDPSIPISLSQPYDATMTFSDSSSPSHSSADCEVDGSEDEDSDSDIVIVDRTFPRPMKPLPKRRPEISVLPTITQDTSPPARTASDGSLSGANS